MIVFGLLVAVLGEFVIAIEDYIGVWSVVVMVQSIASC